MGPWAHSLEALENRWMVARNPVAEEAEVWHAGFAPLLALLVYVLRRALPSACIFDLHGRALPSQYAALFAHR